MTLKPFSNVISGRLQPALSYRAFKDLKNASFTSIERDLLGCYACNAYTPTGWTISFKFWTNALAVGNSRKRNRQIVLSGDRYLLLLVHRRENFVSRQQRHVRRRSKGKRGGGRSYSRRRYSRRSDGCRSHGSRRCRRYLASIKHRLNLMLPWKS